MLPFKINSFLFFPGAITKPEQEVGHSETARSMICRVLAQKSGMWAPIVSSETKNNFLNE
jgi:hypothetical protein